jgi:MoaA/NifB/PqqE/SkfB family radical SAM enzyme
MIDEQTVQWLKLRAPGRVNITLYGASRDTYRSICGQADGYDRAVRAIHLLKDAGIPVVINASMIPENAEDLEKIMKFGKERNINTRVATYMFPHMRRDREAQDSRFTPEESASNYLRKMRCMMTQEAYTEFLTEQLDKSCTGENSDDTWGTNQSEFMRCRAGRSTFWINWEGNMTACGMLDFPMVMYPFVQTFRECWHKLTDCVRTTPVLSGCAGCDKREICNPCVAMIYGETGTVDQKAPYMCQLAESVLRQMKQELEEVQHE